MAHLWKNFRRTTVACRRCPFQENLLRCDKSFVQTLSPPGAIRDGVLPERELWRNLLRCDTSFVQTPSPADAIRKRVLSERELQRNLLWHARGISFAQACCTLLRGCVLRRGAPLDKLSSHHCGMHEVSLSHKRAAHCCRCAAWLCFASWRPFGQTFVTPLHEGASTGARLCSSLYW